MKVSEFDYELPEELIAQEPIYPRDHSRLMVIDKRNNNIIHKKFYNLIHFLESGDVLVLNNTKVLPARLFGQKKDTGALIEIVLLKRLNNTDWEVLVKPGRKVKKDTIITFPGEELYAVSIANTEAGGRILRFKFKGIFEEILNRLGKMPLPPYIKKDLKDQTRYQTVYAKEEGSAAAPTAGLHFTAELLDRIKQKGIEICYITLHVGLGTFRPVKTEELEEHHMHEEYLELSSKTAKILKSAQAEGRRIIAVGTTSVRTLESIAIKFGEIREYKGFTDIFIYPGFKFKVINGLLTNFHLPKSTLIMLVSAFLGKDETLHAYKVAVQEKYRFFSFGDAMLII
ncbi:MAG: tRNA preQ1(34) S-adenosylmethionine ribosyltransferase-isomerase QueA [Zhaonellaceae bacterium]|jgi:S-adenosylmethionine:tRNA ribosyltransferase-isomerase